MTEGSFQFSFDSHFLQQKSFLDRGDIRPSLCSPSGNLIYAMTFILQGESSINTRSPDFEFPLPTLVISNLVYSKQLEKLFLLWSTFLLWVLWLRISTSSYDPGSRSGGFNFFFYCVGHTISPCSQIPPLISISTSCPHCHHPHSPHIISINSQMPRELPNLF